MSRKGIIDYETRRVRHRPKAVVSRDRYVLIHGEPICGAPYAPGSTSIDESRINCPECAKKRGDA